MKRFLAVLTALLLALSLAACGGESGNRLQDTVDSILSKEDEESSSHPPFAVGEGQAGQPSEPPQEPPVPPEPPAPTDPPLPPGPTDPPKPPPGTSETYQRPEFKPPANYYVKFLSGTFDESGAFIEGGEVLIMLKLGNYSVIDSDDHGVVSKEHKSTETNTIYHWDLEYAEYGWTVSEDYDGTWTKGLGEHELHMYPCDEWYRTGFEDKGYQGTEKIGYTECYVYLVDELYLDGSWKKYWVDPSNGVTKKYLEYSGNEITGFEVTDYILWFPPKWDNYLRPEPYSSATRPW